MCEVFSELGYALVLFFSSTINVGVGEEEPRLFWEQDVTASSSGVTRTKKRNGSTPQRKQGLITLVSKLKWWRRESEKAQVQITHRKSVRALVERL